MNITINYRNTCRVCDSKNLHRILSFPDFPLHDAFVKLANTENEFSADLNIYLCLDCHTVQTQHDVNLDAYYKNYQYSVGHSKTVNHFMQVLAQNLTNKYFKNNKKLNILEVGSGDGSQLMPFKEMGHEVLGYEASSYVANIATKRSIPTINDIFNKDSINKFPNHLLGNIDIILTSYTFDHLPDPVAFLNASKLMLNPQYGILVIEIHDIEMIFANKEPGLFQHEHSIYLNKSTAQSMLAKVGFDIIDFNIVPNALKRANSLLLVSTLKDSKFSVERLPKIDMPNFVDIDFYKKQIEDFYQGIYFLEVFLENLILDGKIVAAYGAGPRGVLTLSLMKNGNEVSYLVDKNPKGNAIYAPKSGIPVFGLERLTESPVDVIIVFCFGYMKEVTEDLKKLGYQASQLYSMVDITCGHYIGKLRC